jgi:signal transduction histidine kinase
MIVLWVLQVFFLSNYYQEMKIRETENAAGRIAALYEAGELTEIRDQITDIFRSNDMYIEIQTENGLALYIPNLDYLEDSVSGEEDTSGLHGESSDVESGATVLENENLEETKAEDALVTPHLSPSSYRAEIDNLRTELMDGTATSFSKQVTDQKTGLITLEYATYLTSINEDRNILYVFSPLYPMQSTIDILKSQLVYITIIAMIMAFLVSLYLSRKITNPLVSITESAARLGEGEYGIVFDGGQYSETAKLADTLTYTSLELAKADNLQKDVIANVSHDLRTPLTMVVSYAEMIRDLSGDDPEKRNQHLGVIIDEAERLNQLVTDLLEISRMQSGVLEITLSEFSLKDTIEELLQAYTGFVEREGFKLVFISSGQGMIHADQALIKQVIDNLVSNAFKYSGRDRTVEVKMFDEGDYVRCEVSDHGIGITKKDLKHIWERYYRASTNYHRSDSTGLGLSIVKQSLILHGANFGVESALKKGSTFWFEIKKAGPEEAKPQDRDEGGEAVPGEGAQGESEQSEIPGSTRSGVAHADGAQTGDAWIDSYDKESAGDA